MESSYPKPKLSAIVTLIFEGKKNLSFSSSPASSNQLAEGNSGVGVKNTKRFSPLNDAMSKLV